MHQPFLAKMKVRYLSLLSFFILLLLPAGLYSQYSVNGYIELGNTAVSQGMYGGFSGQVTAKFGTFRTTAGSFLSLSNNNHSIFNGLSLQASNDFKIAKLPINIAIFYQWKPFSASIEEHNAGLLAEYKSKHVGCAIGLDNRIYHFTNDSIIALYSLKPANTLIWEGVNVMYRFSYFQQFSPTLNFEACVTNFDSYTIQQETNPMLRTKLSYKQSEKLSFYGELQYLQAGLLNMRVNYFGLLARGGVIWHI